MAKRKYVTNLSEYLEGKLNEINEDVFVTDLVPNNSNVVLLNIREIQFKIPKEIISKFQDLSLVKSFESIKQPFVISIPKENLKGMLQSIAGFLINNDEFKTYFKEWANVELTPETLMATDGGFSYPYMFISPDMNLVELSINQKGTSNVYFLTLNVTPEVDSLIQQYNKRVEEFKKDVKVDENPEDAKKKKIEALEAEKKKRARFDPKR